MACSSKSGLFGFGFTAGGKRNGLDSAVRTDTMNTRTRFFDDTLEFVHLRANVKRMSNLFISFSLQKERIELYGKKKR